MTGPLYLDFEALHRLFHPSTPPPEDDPVTDPDIYHDDPDRDRPFDYTLDDPDRDRCDS